MPALAGPRYPMFVRMLLALAVSTALAPLIIGRGDWHPAADDALVGHAISELFTGFLIGFWSYCFVHAVHFAATYVTNAIGLGGVPGQPLADHEADGALGTILSLGFVALIFATNLHLISVRGLISSYTLVPVGGLLEVKVTVQHTLEILTHTSAVSLQMSAPFMILSVVANFALGVVNRLTPQLSVFFAFTGLVTMASLVVMAAVSPSMMLIAADAYRDFLENSLS
jgi:flagellar biosynthetic protein FliR